MAEKAIKVELSEEDRKILLAQKKILGDVLKPEKKNKGLGALAAELILSGKNTSVTGALGSATKQKAIESLQDKTKQIKEKFDPLNIINSMFGGGGFGSVMTAAVGKSMGRSEDDIRKFGNLDAAEKSSTPENTVPTQVPTGEGVEKSDTMLSEMLKYVIKISEDIRGLKDSSKNQEELFKDQLTLDEKQLNLEEKQLDAANESRYEDMFGKKPTQVGADGKDKKETKEEKGFLASLLGFASALGMLVSGPFRAFAAVLAFALSPLRALGKLIGGPLLRGLAALGAVALPAARAIGAKAVEGAKVLGAKVAEKAPTLVAGAKAIGSKAVDIGKNIGAKVAEKAPGIIEGVKTMGGKALEGAKSLGGKAMESVGLKAAATVPGALTPFGEVGAKRAAAAGAEAAGKEGVAALIKKSIAKRVPKAVASAVGKSIPFLGAAIGVGFALSRLMDGDVVGAGLEAVSGIGSFATAIPATVALIAKDIYEDVYGIKPESDPLVGERLGLIQSETEAAVKAEFSSKVGEEEKKGGDKKEGASEQSNVPQTPELKSNATPTTMDYSYDNFITKNPNTSLTREEFNARKSSDANISQGQGQQLKSEPAGIGANQPAPTSKTNTSIAPTPASQKPMPNWEASLREYETSTPANHLSSQYPGIENKFRELAKKNKPRSDSFQSIQIHEQMLVTKALGELKDGKVTSPAAEEMKQKSVNSEKLAANITQGQGQQLKSGPAGIGDNQPAPTSKTDATIAPTQEKRKMPNWETALKEYETGTPVDKYERQFPGIKAKFIELAKKNPPSMDIPQVIETHEKILATRAMDALKDKQVDSPEMQRMREIESKPKLQPAQPTTGEKMTKQSNENNMAKTEAMTGGNSTNTSIVSAPKVTNATNVTNAPINVRNSENTFVRNQDRIHDF